MEEAQQKREAQMHRDDQKFQMHVFNDAVRILFPLFSSATRISTVTNDYMVSTEQL